MSGVISSVVATAMILAATLQGLVLLLDPRTWTGPGTIALALLSGGVAIVSAPLVFLLAWGIRPSSRAASASALLAASGPLVWTAALAVGAWGWLPGGTVLGPVAEAWARRTSWLALAAPWIGLGAALALSAVYPAGRDGSHLPSRRRGPMDLALRAQELAFQPRRLVMVTGVVLAVIVGGPIGTSAVAQQLELSGGVLEVAIIALAAFSFLAWVVAVVLAAIRNFLDGISVASEGEQNRALWSITGLVIAGGCVLLTCGLWLLDLFDALPDTEVDDLLMLFPLMAAPLAVVIGLYLAVFYEGTLDPRLVLRRSAITGLLTFVVTCVFALTELGLSEVLDSLSPGAGSLSGWAAGVVAAIGIGPIHTRVKKRVDEWVEAKIPIRDLASSPRERVAILFSDIVGYTGLAAENEDDALTLMSVFQRAARSAASGHEGRLVKTMGDGVLLEFGDPTSAVHAARRLALSFAEACRPLDLAPAPLRAGIHVGDVARRQDGDVFGDAVNVASRLERVAEPGQIIVSQTVADQLEGIELEDLGERNLKNVPRPVRVWAVRSLL